MNTDWVLLLLFLHLSVHGIQGLRCHQCAGVTDPHYCSLVVHCAADEECHTEKVIGEDSTVFYNAGCQKIQLCQLAANGKRSDLHVCEGCCGTDQCNAELCPAGNHTTPGIQCYQCDQVDAPQDCHNRVTCADGEQCIVQEYANGKLEVKYSLGCKTKQRCNLLQKPSKRSRQICNECCATPGCNRHLCENGSTTSSSCKDEPYVDCKLADGKHSICAERTLAAVKYCRKYCGYCSADGSTLPPPTGTTVDTCKDSGDVDCKLMNDSLHICALKDSPPTLFHCPNFCGICTSSSGGMTTPVTTAIMTRTTAAVATAGSTTSSSCKDEPYIDCKLADDTHSICVERTLAAVKYCQKYCGFCSADGSTLPPPTGTTVDTCKDSGDIDCKQMNDSLHICALKDSPPTLFHCPNFCGICTPSGGGMTTLVTSTTTTVAAAVTGSTTNSSCRDEAYIDCKLADDTHSICAERTLAAVKYCQKYCGYCSDDGSTLPPPTGTTVDTCKDSGDLDCKLMNDSLHVCALKDSPPTLFHCPNFCGICTPSSGGMSTIVTSTTTARTTTGSTTSSSCRDEAYIDCKLADDTHSICAERTLAAVKYCQKYCGYCSDDGSTLPPPTGTTVDTCKDSGDLDCKLMNDSLHICALKDSPPTLFHCPNFCGICTPSGDKVLNPTSPQVTTVPVTKVPVATVPVTTVPVATVPVTTVPVATVPVTTVPVATVPETTLSIATQSKAKMTTRLPTTKALTRQPTVNVTTPGTTLAASTGPPPKTLPPIATTCAVCAGPKFLCEKLYAPTPCLPPNNYCINTITNHKNGTRSVDRTCGSFDTCYREWFLGSSDNDKCRKFSGNDEQRLDFQCTFCCIKDNCNNPLHPTDNTLYKPV